MASLADQEPEMKRTEWLEACGWAYGSEHQGWLENVITVDKKASTMGKALNIQVDKNDISQYMSSPDMMDTWVFKAVEIEVTRYDSLDCCLPKPIQLLPPLNIQLAGNRAQGWAPDMAFFWSSRTGTGTWDSAFLTRTQMMPLIPTMPVMLVYALQLEK